MPRLRIEQYGPAINLYAGLITQDQMIQLEKSCAPFFGVYRKKKLNAVWYHNRSVMKKILGVADWRELTTDGYHYCGPLLASEEARADFLEYFTIFLDGHETRFQTDKIKCRFAGPKPPPPVGPEEILVFHGECCTDFTIFERNIDTEFNVGKLTCWFEDCGENGFVLKQITYGSETLHRIDPASKKEVLHLQFYAGR